MKINKIKFMKPLIFILTLFALVSCSESKKQDTVVKNSKYSNSWIKEMKFNNGLKWKANIETNEGVLRMQKSIETQPTNTLVEYYQLAEKLNKDKNYVIKYCSMKGEPHENLHVWLMPLIAKIKALSEVKSIKDASKLKQSIKENINAYSNYFE